MITSRLIEVLKFVLKHYGDLAVVIRESGEESSFLIEDVQVDVSMPTQVELEFKR